MKLIDVLKQISTILDIPENNIYRLPGNGYKYKVNYIIDKKNIIILEDLGYIIDISYRPFYYEEKSFFSSYFKNKKIKPNILNDNDIIYTGINATNLVSFFH